VVVSLRSQRQASTTFDLGGATAPRSKGAFYVVFNIQNPSVGVPTWARDLGFLVKSTTNPTVTPKVEEINQYNKKRQIYTGFTYSPVTISLYDTVDATALRMWNEYAAYYFGDYNHASIQDWGFDVVPQAGQTNMFGDTIGYGYQPRPSIGNGIDPTNFNSQFFFMSIDVYQVARNTYTMYSLVNPKITSWETEELDFEQFSPVMYHVQVAYEAALWANNGAPQPLSSNSMLSQVFGETNLSGDFLDVAGVAAIDPSSSTAAPPPLPLASQFTNSGSALSGLAGLGAGSLRSGLGGVLNNFGNFNFGAALGTAAQTAGVANNLSQLASSVSNNPALASALSIVSTVGQQNTGVGGQLTVGQNPNGINSATYDAAVAAVSSASGSINNTDMGPAVVSGVMAMSTVTGQSPSSALSNQGGFSMAPQIYGVVNQTRSAMSQIGFNDQSPDDDTFTGSSDGGNSDIGDSDAPGIDDTGDPGTDDNGDTDV
jgi:hypothetical protein